MQGAGLAHHGDNLQDILRILTLWFNYGALPDVEQALQDGFDRVTVDTWLVVIPQARMVLQKDSLHEECPEPFHLKAMIGHACGDCK